MTASVTLVVLSKLQEGQGNEGRELESILSGALGAL